MRRLFLDTETFSPYDVTKVGVEKHIASGEVILASFAMNDGPVHLWEIGQDPDQLLTYIEKAHRLIAHNAWFDRNAVEHEGWCDRPMDAWHCTMAQALAHSLPAGLDALGRFLGIPPEFQKKGTGKDLMRLFSKPQRDGSRLTKEDLPDKWEEWREYAEFDIHALRWIFHRLPRINFHE